MLASRVVGLGWRESAVIGALMNTRGLTELIVLNLALEKGVISEALFAALVLMALVTTFMAGPVLNRLDPRNEFGEPVEAELDRARAETAAITPMPIPEQSILVAPQTEAALAQLLAVAVPLATSEPPRELIVARLIEPPRGAAVRGGLQTESFILADASRELERVRGELLERGVPARAVAFTSTDAGRDLAKLADREDVDLVLIDGRRPLRGEGVPRGDVGSVLRKAPERRRRPRRARGRGRRAGRRCAAGRALRRRRARLGGARARRLAGRVDRRAAAAAGRRADGEEDASRLLATASLLVQRFVGVAAEPLLAEPGREGLLRAAAGAGLLVIGLSDRWREEGLGPVRHEIAAAAPAPILFVRRGLRPGALAPRTDVTQFTWSHVGRRDPGLRRDQAGSPTRGGAWCTPDGAGTLRSSSGIWLTDENSRTSRISPGPRAGSAASSGIGSISGGTDQPVWRNSPAFSIQLSERIGRITTLVQMASVQASQNHHTASIGLRPTSRTWASV